MKNAATWPASTALVGAALVAIAVVSGHAQGAKAVPWVPPDTPKGTGSYKALMEMDAMLPTHTVYRPADLAQLGSTRLPIIAWGNGACVNAGNRFRHFLTEVASHGYLIVALGPVGARVLEDGPDIPTGVAGAPPAPAPARAGGPPPGPATKFVQLTYALDWAIAENTRRGSKYLGKLDTTKVVVMGQSCGGVQAIAASTDPRVTLTVAWNSGLVSNSTPLMEDVSKDTLAKLHAPIAYFTGGPGDVAYPNADDDFKRLAAEGKLPVIQAYKDGLPHNGTYREENGGELGKIAVSYLAWRLKGDETAGRMFKGANCGLCSMPGWHVNQSKID
jgi:dienelactone hydrolase